jgi:hypothetical protein
MVDFGWASIKVKPLGKEKGKDKKGSKKVLDFSSSAAIHKTAKMIRNDIRIYKLSYFNGMVILIKARNNLKKMLAEVKKDKKKNESTAKVAHLERRVQVIESEIRYTKKELMEKFGNPETMTKNKIFTNQEKQTIRNFYRPIKLITV